MLKKNDMKEHIISKNGENIANNDKYFPLGVPFGTSYTVKFTHGAMTRRKQNKKKHTH